jgi:hypothetical protein
MAKKTETAAIHEGFMSAMLAPKNAKSAKAGGQ